MSTVSTTCTPYSIPRLGQSNLAFLSPNIVQKSKSGHEFVLMWSTTKVQLPLRTTVRNMSSLRNANRKHSLQILKTRHRTTVFKVSCIKRLTVLTRGQSHLAKAAPNDPTQWSWVKPHVTDRQMDTAHSVTIVCISCIRCSLKMVDKRFYWHVRVWQMASRNTRAANLAVLNDC